MDYYKILEVSKTASKIEIKKAYKKLALKLHPDTSGRNSAAEFRKVNEAYETLIDDYKRKSYDNKLKEKEHKPKQDSDYNRQKSYNNSNTKSNGSYNRSGQNNSSNSNGYNANKEREKEKTGKQDPNGFSFKDFYQKYKNIKISFDLLKKLFDLSWSLDLLSVIKISFSHFFVWFLIVFKKMFFKNYKPKKFKNSFFRQIEQMVIEADLLKNFVFAIAFLFIFCAIFIVRVVPVFLTKVFVMFVRGAFIYALAILFFVVILLIAMVAAQNDKKPRRRRRR